MFKKIRNKVNSAVAAVKATVACKKAEGYVDSGVKILIAVVIGALLLGAEFLLLFFLNLLRRIGRIRERLDIMDPGMKIDQIRPE